MNISGLLYVYIKLYRPMDGVMADFDWLMLEFTTRWLLKGG